MKKITVIPTNGKSYDVKVRTSKMHSYIGIVTVRHDDYGTIIYRGKSQVSTRCPRHIELVGNNFEQRIAYYATPQAAGLAIACSHKVGGAMIDKTLMPCLGKLSRAIIAVRRMLTLKRCKHDDRVINSFTDCSI